MFCGPLENRTKDDRKPPKTPERRLKSAQTFIKEGGSKAVYKTYKKTFFLSRWLPLSPTFSLADLFKVSTIYLSSPGINSLSVFTLVTNCDSRNPLLTNCDSDPTSEIPFRKGKLLGNHTLKGKSHRAFRRNIKNRF